VLALADKGLQALQEDRHLLNGLNVHQGKITNQAVATAHGLAYCNPSTALGKA